MFDVTESLFIETINGCKKKQKCEHNLPIQCRLRNHLLSQRKTQNKTSNHRCSSRKHENTLTHQTWNEHNWEMTVINWSSFISTNKKKNRRTRNNGSIHELQPARLRLLLKEIEHMECIKRSNMLRVHVEVHVLYLFSNVYKIFHNWLL